MELKDMTKTQLYRLFFRIKSQLYGGGMYGWDWRTLHSAYPAKYHLMRSIAWAHDRAPESLKDAMREAIDANPERHPASDKEGL